MNYKENVEKKITGEGNELNRRKELWEKIINAYEQGGKDAIKSVLIKESDDLMNKFNNLLEQLNKKLQNG